MQTRKPIRNITISNQGKDATTLFETLVLSCKLNYSQNRTSRSQTNTTNINPVLTSSPTPKLGMMEDVFVFEIYEYVEIDILKWIFY